MYQVGTLAKILKMLVLPDGNTTIIIQGQSRFKIEEEAAEHALPHGPRQLRPGDLPGQELQGP